MKNNGILILKILMLAVLFLPMSCFDTDPITDENGNELSYHFVSGPENENYYTFAKGLIDAAGESLGVFMNNHSTAGSLDNAVRLARGSAYMGLVQEDVFRFCRDTFIKQYNSDPGAAEKKYLEVASRLKIVMAAYNEDVFLLVKSGITDISQLNMKYVNIGPVGSGTYITASSVLEGNNINYCYRLNLDVSTAVQKIVNGDADCDATFIVSVSPNPVLQAIPADAAVQLIRVSMPAGKKYYDETGLINADDYPFQLEPVSNNMTVKTLVAAGPGFNDRAVDLFINYVFENAREYEGFNSKWKDVNLSFSFEYMRDNPQLANYRAFCAIAAAPVIDAFTLQSEFYSGEYGSSYSDLATELIWLMSNNLDIDLKERNSTGSRENAIRIADGTASMGIIQDDLIDFFEKNHLMTDSLQIASMKKIMPLHYEYLHLLRNTASGTGPVSIADFPNRRINLGPKTSGTFITAMSLIKSYGYDESDNISYFFDSPGDAVSRVNDGEYDASFVMSGLPFYRFYSHDTWDVTQELNNSNLVGCAFNGSVPHPYDLDGIGKIRGNGNVVFEHYPYPVEACSVPYDPDLEPDTITTIRVRALLVASPEFDESNISTFITSVFRKSYYMTNPPDQDLWPSKNLGGDYQPDQVWIPIRKTTINDIHDLDNYDSDVTTLEDRGVYDEIMGAKEYFLHYPYGWSEHAAEYYLSMFPDN